MSDDLVAVAVGAVAAAVAAVAAAVVAAVLVYWHFVGRISYFLELSSFLVLRDHVGPVNKRKIKDKINFHSVYHNVLK